MKIKAIIKKYTMAIVAIAMVAGFSAFQLIDEPQNGWYEISTPSGDPDLPNNQFIGAHLPSGPAAGCDVDAEDTPPCAVFLKLSPTATTSPTGMSVATATDTNGYNAEIDNSESNDGYARQENP